MLRSLHVENFRALREFRMTGLGRVNLLVGTNNCGKTSVLEAVHVLLSPGTSAIWRSLSRRGEYKEGASARDGMASRREVAVAHLVHGHRADVDSRFAIAGANDASSPRVEALIRPMIISDANGIPLRARLRKQQQEFLDDDGAEPSRLILEVGWHEGGKRTATVLWPVSAGGGLDRAVVGAGGEDNAAPVQFVTTEGLSPAEVVELFGETALTPEEESILQALRIIEPGLQRVAIVGGGEAGSLARTRASLAVMLDGTRIPIGSMGDGIWRLLGIALALVRASDGVLLVDEIDTGLHYTVLEKMWRLVFETAERLNVQVFATTHSRDCYEALAAITQRDRREVSIQRIERGRVDAIGFSEGAIAAAAAGDIEVR